MDFVEVEESFRRLVFHRAPGTDLLCLVDLSLDEDFLSYDRLRSFAERFWDNVDRSGYCWEWQGTPNKNGYGWALGGPAHRVAYALAVGDPNGGVVAHVCDNSLCCRPSHLVLRTNSENIREMHQKGRANYVARKLRPETVREIRVRHQEGVSVKNLAERFGLNYMHVWNIVRRKTWRHLP